MLILNEWGLAIWKHKQIPNIIIERSYSWCNHYIMIDENFGRLVIAQGKISEFNFNDWIPLTSSEYKEKCVTGKLGEKNVI